MTVLSFGSGPIILVCMRKQMPDQERPFNLGRAAWPVAFLVLLSTNLIIYWAGWAQSWKMMLAIVLGYWVLLWFAGITIISYLGKYSGTTATRAGQLNLLGFTGGILANLGLTVAIMAIAWTCQLPSDRVHQILAESGHPEQADPAE